MIIVLMVILSLSAQWLAFKIGYDKGEDNLRTIYTQEVTTSYGGTHGK